MRPLAVGLALALATTACVGAGEPDDGTTEEPVVSDRPSGEPVPGGALTVGIEAETSGWSPWSDTWAQSGTLVALAFYEPLMTRDAEGRPRPNLAESMEPNDEHTEWTIVLRDGIAFHDGTPLDAQAVKVNLDRHREPGSATSGQVAPIEEVVVVDDRTVRLELDQPHVALDDVLARQAGYMAAVATVEDESADRSPVGTGPFVFESWQRDQQLTVTRNEDYWRDGLPYLEEITFRPIPDEDARLQSLLSGDVDVMQSLRQSIVAQARERDAELNLYEHLGNNSGGAIYNLAVPPTDDLRVRRAIAHALDQEELVAVLGGTGISPSSKGLFTPESRWYDEDTAALWPGQDLERAQELIDEYVADTDRSDGQPVGSPVHLTVDTPPDPSLLETAAAYQQQLGRIGVEVDIATVEQAVHIQEAVGQAPDFVGDFQAKFWRLGDDFDQDWMVNWFAPGSPVNFMNVESEELMGILLEARRTPDFEDRKQRYNEAMAWFAEQVPFTLSGFTASVLAADDGVFGFDEWVLPDGDPGFGQVEGVAPWHQVWVDR